MRRNLLDVSRPIAERNSDSCLLYIRQILATHLTMFLASLIILVFDSACRFQGHFCCRWNALLSVKSIPRRRNGNITRKVLHGDGDKMPERPFKTKHLVGLAAGISFGANGKIVDCRQRFHTSIAAKNTQSPMARRSYRPSMRNGL